MARPVKIPTADGKVIDGEEISFTPQTEPWCVYQLEDGYTLRLKLILTQVIRTNQHDAEGNPIYAAKSSNVVAVSPPEKYRTRDLQ